ncbi:sporulation histidine kinase inhibitor Sda [Bacillus thermotolerans]|uniref:Sporulation histidine kinase inhibitor Sda n=1 Tax=Bacillus thermotolerans TaxID=1221996 RepID=A0A0F5I568_BACTR|nr:sporulation histidine kinase inhibitor Sda [Bacillus thermotolerans]KKB38015.1 hypothetical protein QY97_03390 [Bacillus thermotolerans]KKB40676.1 hypothetical protein QY95_01250 [Bacillus thermotolerans]KKB43789.1 hypothetical protein QY96_00558 [Bacillus thermotolerans]
MRQLTDELLLLSYEKAVDYSLEEEFIHLLENEIEQRGLADRLIELNSE